MSGKSGGCECGSVRYEVAADNLHVYACHCLNCQTRSGSAFAEHAMLETAAFQCGGETVTRSRIANGMQFEEFFCVRCFTRIYNRNSALPGFVFLRAGTLSGSQDLAPIAHIWIKRRQRWISIPATVAAFEESPTPEQFNAVVQEASRCRVGASA